MTVNHDSLNALIHMQLERYEIFKAQDHEKGHFDCALIVNGKKLYCHKFVLATASETFNALLSVRWKTANANVIKINNPDYSYENIHQLISFLYGGSCTLTKENIFIMTDMAEYYSIIYLKNNCDIFLSKMEISIQNIGEMIEFAEKYSLINFSHVLKYFIRDNFKAVVDSEQFLKYKKSFGSVVDFLHMK